MILKENYEVPTPLRGVAEIRSLDALAKTDPIAAELSAIREAVDSVKEAVAERHYIVPTHLRTEQEVLRKLVASAFSGGDYWTAVAMGEVGREGTSKDFRQWLDKLVAEHAAEPVAEQSGLFKDVQDARRRFQTSQQRLEEKPQRPADEWTEEPPF